MAISVKTRNPITVAISGIQDGMGWPSTKETAIADRLALIADVKPQGMNSAVHGTASTKSVNPRIRNRGTPITNPRILDNALSMTASDIQNSRLRKSIPTAPAYGRTGKVFPVTRKIRR